MKIGVIGSGGREHALAWKLEQSPLASEVYVIPGNGGTPNKLVKGVNDFKAISTICAELGIELLVVGPEDPLANGISDFFADTPIKVFGPSQDAARLEGSKIWAKEFMKKYDVATADFWSCETPQCGRETLTDVDEGPIVVKFDGLAAGKGVFVCGSRAEAVAALDTVESQYGPDAPVVIEECLVGQEISILGITDGTHIKLLTPSQDHKQRFEKDRGPNTGGMGAFCPVPQCDDALLERIVADVVEPTMKGIQAEKLDYIGIVYFGIMVTKEGPKLLEYNVRLGDPETEVVLPKLASDLVPILLSCFDGTLGQQELTFHEGTFVDVVLASEGYPGTYEKGVPISGLDDPLPGTLIFHAGTRKKGEEIVTAGGRVLNVVAQGDTLDEAIKLAYQQVQRISFANKVFRKDIGRREWTL